MPKNLEIVLHSAKDDGAEAKRVGADLFFQRGDENLVKWMMNQEGRKDEGF